MQGFNFPSIAQGDKFGYVVDNDMSGGHVYQVSLGISFVDSYGNGPSSSATYHKVSIKANGMGGSTLGRLYNVLSLAGLFAIIALCIIVYVWARKNWVPRRKKNAAPPYIVGSEPPQQPQ